MPLQTSAPTFEAPYRLSVREAWALMEKGIPDHQIEAYRHTRYAATLSFWDLIMELWAFGHFAKVEGVWRLLKEQLPRSKRPRGIWF